MIVAGAKARPVPDPSGSFPPPSWKSIVEPVRPFLDQVEQNLHVQVEAFDPKIATFARYALTSQGKHLRPLLVALSADAAGKVNDSTVKVAVIIEMIHLATLVHDDVMDEAAIRRRRPTLAANWGNQISVLVGDCLFAHALKLAASFPTPDVCRAVAAATNTVCSGEILQSQNHHNLDLSRAEYFRILEMKTAELFALSCDLGAGLGGAGPNERAALRAFGLALGTAYQIYDDCLDLYGKEETVGKSLGTDLANGKFTLPILVTLERCSVAARSEFQHWIDSWDPRALPKVLEWLQRHDARSLTASILHEVLEQATNALSPLAPSRAKETLEELTGFLERQAEGLSLRAG